MRVALVTHRYPPNAGGVETHVAALATRLVERGHEVVVVSADAAADVPVRQVRDGVRVRRAWALAPDDAIHAAPGVVPAVRDVDADVVHAHNYHALPAALGALAARLDGRPLVVTPHYHGRSADGTRDRLLRAYRPVGGRALRAADAVLAVSGWERDRLRTDFGVDARVVPNGLDVARFRDAEPARRDRPYLLTVGRLVDYKGVDHAIRALARLPDYDLLVAGSGPARDRLAETARRAGVADRVEFLGYVDDDRLPGLYAGAAAHLLLSAFEAYGMTVAESLAAGTPAVVRETGALVEWADRDDCVGVRAVAPATVADAVGRAVDLSATAAGLWTWDEVTDAVAAAYDGLLSGAGVAGT